MLLPWSKKITLAIAHNGIAIKLPDHRSELIASGQQTINSETLLSALTPHVSALKGQHMNVVISNHFLRYAVLPWQDGVSSREDWLALAEHAFRTQYGAVTEDWDFRVNLNKAGAPIVASAMDNSITHALTQTAESLSCKLASIEPLLMRVSALHNNNSSFLVAEPERLLLCELDEGTVTRFTASSPPQQQEADNANQLVARYSLQSRQKSNPVFSYISSVLNEHWVNGATNNQQHVVKLNKHAASHACWMAEL